jgi:hypothetical protein
VLEREVSGDLQRVVYQLPRTYAVVRAVLLQLLLLLLLLLLVVLLLLMRNS